MNSTRIFIVGCGYVGRRLLAALGPQSPAPLALQRSPQGAAAARALGAETVQLDLDALEPLASGLRPAAAGSAMYYFAPPPPTGSSDPRLRAWLQCLHGEALPRRLVYISTSGVYGDCAGDWIDEDRPPRPQSGRARRRLDAEQALQAFSAATGVPVVILRVPGIYGPGHLPLQRLRQGLAVLAADQAPWTNRVHVDDLVAVAQAAMQRGRPGAAYNVSDGTPGRMADYFDAIADVFGLPRPPKVDREQALTALTAGMRAFMGESRRLLNRRMVEELGVRPRYPGLQAGLAQCLAEARASGEL